MWICRQGNVAANRHMNGFFSAVSVMIRTAENPEFSTSLSEGRKKAVLSRPDCHSDIWTFSHRPVFRVGR